MIFKRFIFISMMLAIFGMAGCTPTQQADVPDLAEMQVAVQQTLDYERAVNAQLTQAALADQPPATPQPPTQEILPTVEPTSSYPYLTVSYDSNCREGPNAEIWRSIGGVMIGQKAEIVAVYNKGHWYIVKNPANPNERCWVWDYYATVVGDISLLPKATIPPTPTPKP